MTPTKVIAAAITVISTRRIMRAITITVATEIGSTTVITEQIRTTGLIANAIIRIMTIITKGTGTMIVVMTEKTQLNGGSIEMTEKGPAERIIHVKEEAEITTTGAMRTCP
jgi:hypothetical protein